MTYEESKQFIKDLPMTWIPALLVIMVKTAIDKKCFKKHMIHTFIRKVEVQYAHDDRTPTTGT